MILAIIPSFLPATLEITLLAGILILLVFSLFIQKQAIRWCFYIAEAFLLVSFIVACFMPTSTQITFEGFFIHDALALFCKVLLILTTLFSFILMRYSMSTGSFGRVEYPILLLLALLGMMIMVSAHDLLSVFMGIELQSLALYIIVAARRNHPASHEAALKYFILGALSTGFFLYGASLVYGSAAATNFQTLERFYAATVSSGGQTTLLHVGMILILVSVGFKLSLAPVHMWAPDVYQGTPTSVLTFLSTVPKIAAFVVLIRLLTGPFSALYPVWQGGLLVFSALSMFWGSIAALSQQNIKRLMAYSSIGHMGFAVIGVYLMSDGGLKATLTYLVFYALMTVGFFGGILYMIRHGRNIQQLSDLNGIGRIHPIMAFFLAFILFSMAGIPPLPGFLPKFLMLKAAMNQNAYAISVIAVIYSVIAAAYYLVILKTIFFDKQQVVPVTAGVVHHRMFISMMIVLSIIFIGLILLFVYPNFLMTRLSDVTAKLMY